jgi:hypothetical protein
MLVMPSAVGFIVQHFVLVIFALAALAGLIAAWMRRPVPPEEAANWPVADGTIQTVVRMVGRTSENPDSHYVGDFSYTVNNEYYSGRVSITRSFSTHGNSAEDLVNQKFQVRYHPQKPEKFSIPPQELGTFLLDPYQ